MKARDLTNQKFGRWTVLCKCNYKKGARYPWHCRCECGTEKDILPQDLVEGKSKSCGCYQKEIVSRIGKKTIANCKAHQPRIDLVGQRFGKLVVLNRTIKNNSEAFWECQCDCGNRIIVRGNDLRRGNTTSCGCIRSKGELKIIQLLLNNNISFIREYNIDNSTKTGYYRFDFYVDNKYFIEYDGIQHYKNIEYFGSSLKETQKNDAYKNQWCKDNGIPLIRIPYTHYNDLKIEDLLLETSDFII